MNPLSPEDRIARGLVVVRAAIDTDDMQTLKYALNKYGLSIQLVPQEVIAEREKLRIAELEAAAAAEAAADTATPVSAEADNAVAQLSADSPVEVPA